MILREKSTYSLTDKLTWAWRYFRGGSLQNDLGMAETRVDWSHKSRVPEQTILFVGDVMGLSNKKLTFGEDITKLFSQQDHIVANLEGPIFETDHKVFVKQYNSPILLDYLSKLCDISRWCFNLANNHIYDFGEEGVDSTLHHLSSANIQYFGLRNEPYLILERARISAATERENILSSYPVTFRSLESPKDSSRVEILFPHWGEELCYFPSRKLERAAKEYLKDFDMIVGHHSHIAQPTVEYNGKFCSYSLGNLYIYTGKVMLRIGKILEVGLYKDEICLVREHKCFTEFPDDDTIYVELIP